MSSSASSLLPPRMVQCNALHPFLSFFKIASLSF
uniref:Uncharacterized protein n=1 Tax=Arundo donax TaxID=35708 RepID=A0A0A9AUW8_ARUDO